MDPHVVTSCNPHALGFKCKGCSYGPSFHTFSNASSGLYLYTWINLPTCSITSLRSRGLRSKAPSSTSTTPKIPTSGRCLQILRPVLNWTQGSAASILPHWVLQLSLICFGNQFGRAQSQDIRRPKSCPALMLKRRSTEHVRTRGRWHAAPVG
jgi:hypothetical protein